MRVIKNSILSVALIVTLLSGLAVTCNAATMSCGENHSFDRPLGFLRYESTSDATVHTHDGHLCVYYERVEIWRYACSGCGMETEKYRNRQIIHTRIN